MRRALLIALALVAAPALAVPPAMPFGGSVEKMARKIATSPPVEIDGICLSACTMQLAIGCVTPSALLGFHAPQWGLGRKMAERDRQAWAEFIAGYYPPRIAAWYLAGPAREPAVVVLSGPQAVAMGATPCRG